MGKDYAKLEFHVDYYESCCGELTLFYEGGALTAYAIKMTDPPDFAFEIVHPTEGPHYLGKTTFRGLSEHPHIIKDEYIGGKMSMCYLEYYGASSSTRESELFYSTAYSASWFDRDKYKDPRDMPVFSALVVNSSLFCSAEDTKGLDTPSSENCLDPWEIACTYFDNYKSRWH
ncbi:hypothetical protein [Massilia brevitalea]|uniref:hypothetical protein n=1 Tax=Massilia brevitalea TaxID=442526 RepID=UPI0027385111|nr:hypothetical protein [Massilia brevitalea]